MKIAFIVIFLLQPSFSLVRSQIPAGVIYPNKSFTNCGTDTLYYMTEGKVSWLLAGQDSLSKMIHVNLLLTERNRVLDSIAEFSRQMISQKEEEAFYWKEELMRNDKELDNCSIHCSLLQEKLEEKKKNRKWYWLLGGMVAGAVLVL